MKDIIALQFNRKPSSLLTLWTAFRNRNSKFISKEIIPEIHAKRSDLRIDPAHLKSFYSVCAIEPPSNLHILYPFTMVYPYIMRVLCQKEMPLSTFRVLNTRNCIRMFRVIQDDERFEFDCFNSAVRIIQKGIEFDIKSEVSVGTELVWENTSTYFIPGKYGAEEPPLTPPRLESIDHPPVTSQWYLAPKDRFKFAKISGDTNGIHYSPFYARLFGFKRDFSQPIRVVAQCVSNLPNQIADKPAELTFFLKGPVYYENSLTLRSRSIENNNRFDLYCNGNEKPCISGQLDGH